MTRREDGFTLIELLVAITITGVIAAAVGVTFILGLRVSSAASDKLIRSRGAQMTAAFFGRDMQSADDVSLTDTTCSGTPAADPVIVFHYEDTAGVDHHASYVFDAATATLTRRTCTDTVLVGQVVVASSVTAVSEPLAPPGVPCASADPAQPCSLAIKVTVEPVADEDPYVFEVVGARRSAVTP